MLFTWYVACTARFEGKGQLRKQGYSILSHYISLIKDLRSIWSYQSHDGQLWFPVRHQVGAPTMEIL